MRRVRQGGELLFLNYQGHRFLHNLWHLTETFCERNIHWHIDLADATVFDPLRAARENHLVSTRLFRRGVLTIGTKRPSGMNIMSDEVDTSIRTRRLAWLIWIAVAISMSAHYLSGDRHSVIPAYRSATVNWFAGEPLYNMRGSGFIYLPQTALVFAPWGLLPVAVGEVAWRCTIIAIFAAGVGRFTKMVSSDVRWFLINSIVSAITAVSETVRRR
jgi:hypothetical protein